MNFERRKAFSTCCVRFSDALGALADDIVLELNEILKQAPLRAVMSPHGPMSVLITNVGDVGWYASPKGYGYVELDPKTHKPWPAMPERWEALAREAAVQLGFANFEPDSCLVNVYEPGSKLGLHQDKDERDFKQPIVSVSLGLEAMFLWGGPKRTSTTTPLALGHGDVLVFGGPDRMNYHGIAAVAEGESKLGRRRVNLTFRRAR